MKEIKLNKGFVALVDDDDFQFLNQWNWFIGNDGYAKRSQHNLYTSKTICMHRLIMNASRCDIVDHIDMNRLNNQKSNLRLCNRKQNAANSLIPRNNSSGYKGVYWHKTNKKWHAQIKVNYKTIFLGCFNTKEEAALAYNNGALKHQGEFARLNILKEIEVGK